MMFFTSLLNRLFRPKPNAPDAEEREMQIVLIGFAYDEVTNHTSKWLGKNSVGNAEKASVIRVNEINTGRAKLEELLFEEPLTDRVEIFCGHGDFDSLLGPPGNCPSDKELSNTKHSIFYDKDKLSTAYDIRRASGKPVRIAMFAFCCRSAREFGRKFSSFKYRSFIGFNDDLPLHDDLWDVLGDICQNTSRLIAKSGEATQELERGVQRMYDEAIDSYLTKRRKSRHPFLMKLYLEEHKAQLRRF